MTTTNDETIFKILKPDENNLFLNINKKDLKEIINHLNNYYLPLREKINLDETITFGLEIETEWASIKILTEKLKKFIENGWKIDKDRSLFVGAEIISPKLNDDKKTWETLKEVCFILRDNSDIRNSAGGHIHIDKQVLVSYKSYLNFLKLWIAYENVLYRFSYGEYLNERNKICLFATPYSDVFLSDYKYLKEKNIMDIGTIVERLNAFKNQAVSFSRFYDYGTIEIRCPNGSLNEIIWQNNVNLFVKLLKYANNPSFDDDTISKRILKNKKIYKKLEIEKIHLYRAIYLDEALELCDLIFDNNLDKIYFLRQYLKNYEVGNSFFKKAKPFTKL